MVKILGYLKSYTLLLLVCVGLLFIQANMELTLPDYMSRIVNVGLQQGGIDSPVPDAIRRSELDKLEGWFTEAEFSKLKDSYDLIGVQSEKAPQYLEQYPVLASEDVYVLREDEAKRKAGLSQLFSRGFLILAAQQKAGTVALPREMVLAQIGEMDKALAVQAALRVVRLEYEALGVDMGAVQNRYILSTGGYMLLFTLISVFANILVGLIAAVVAAGVAQRVRSDVFRKVETFSGEELDKFSTASLITRSTNDVTQVQMLLLFMVRMVLFAPILGIGGVIRAVGKAPSMAWLIGLAVLVLLGLILLVVVIALPRFTKIQKLVDRLNLVARENLSGLLVVRAFNRQKFEEDRFDQGNRELTSTHLFVNRVMVVMMPVMMLIFNLLTVGIMWFGARQIAASSLQIGDMMAFLQYAMQIVMSFIMLTMMFIFLPRAAVSGARIAEVLNTEPKIRDPGKPRSLPSRVKGVLEFRNVSFRYPGAETDALSGLSFTAEPGKTTAIIGSTGAGKSTTVNLIPRFYDVSAGQILLDGVDIREISQQDLRSRIGYIPQKTTIFSGTINSNLCYADEDASPDTLREAATTAQILEFIESKEEKFDSPVAQHGSNLSGGQKQRLSIARALVKKFPVYIFDDSFSALDFRTDAALRRAMKQTVGESTLLIVAQRVSTIMNAEQIIVLEEGKIVGTGTHRELLQSCETYKEIVFSQLDVKEIA